MTKEDGFYFIPHKWLGDSTIITMDWDCKAMHLHLMAIAWQQEKKGYLLNEDNLLRKILNNPEEADWNNRIKPQLLKAWKIKKIVENGEEISYIYQAGLLKNPTEKKVIKKKNNVSSSENIYHGFNLHSILNASDNSTILYEKPEEATSEEKQTIWKIGVQLVKKQGDSEQKARGFLAKLIKEHGDKRVANAIAQLSIKNINPAEIHSYLIGFLKKDEAMQLTKTGRGKVSI